MNDPFLKLVEKGLIKMPELSIELITQDEEELIEQCCRYMCKLAEVVDGIVEIVVVDGGSKDRTMELAKGVFVAEQPKNTIINIMQNKWPGFAAQRNFIYRMCRGKWILNMATDHLFTDKMFFRINDFLKMDILSLSFGKIHLYKDIYHMLDTSNRDPMIALHRNDGKFTWERTGDLERLHYNGKVVQGHPAHFNLPKQGYVPEIQLIHFEALKSFDSRLQKYIKRSKMKRTNWYGMSRHEVESRLRRGPCICPITKHFPEGLKFYAEIENEIGYERRSKSG